MKYSAAFLLIALLAVVGTASARKGMSVEDRGKDGDERYYRVVCENDRTFMMAHKYKEHKVCFYNGKGEQICPFTDNIDDVARQSCSERH